MEKKLELLGVVAFKMFEMDHLKKPRILGIIERGQQNIVCGMTFCGWN